MTYSKTKWQNREVEFPTRVKLQDNGDGTHMLIPMPGEIIKAGTPLVEAPMNNIEEGVYNATMKLNNLLGLDKNYTLNTSSWAQSNGYWVYKISSETMTVDTVVNVNVRKEDLEKATEYEIQAATESFDGYFNLYAKKRPTSDIVCDIIREKVD